MRFLGLSSKSTIFASFDPVSRRYHRSIRCQSTALLTSLNESVRLSKTTVSTRLAAVASPASSLEDRIPAFPFSAIAGQDELKLALQLNVVDPNVGGVLVMGDRGTGKSVAVRALSELLPEIEVIIGDPFNSHPSDISVMGPEALEKKNAGETFETMMIRTPLIELPLGATEDRICGTIDIERALSEGVRAFEPGLLAKANRGILYVDEVNLLEDGIVDVVLDSAASGMNTVEREGVSILHPAKFIMIGSGNPQEGELRPQLIDRFGLSVQIETVMDRDIRKQIVLNRLSYESDPDAFVEQQEMHQKELREELLMAKERLESVQMDRDLELKVAQICARLKIEGLRGDIVTCRAAKALAALEGRQSVIIDDIERVICLSLNHRMRKDPMDPIDSGSKVKLAFKKMTDPNFKENKGDAASSSTSEKPKEEKKPGSWSGLNF